MFDWIENSAVATWVGQSAWAYPLMLSIHVVGLAIVVGIFSIRDMRLLGMFREIRPASFLSLSKLAWVAFIGNAISGLFLFTSQATDFVESTPFLLKIGFVTSGMVVASMIQSRLRGELANVNRNVTVSANTQVVAAFSLFLWLSAIVSGRLIAYI